MELQPKSAKRKDRKVKKIASCEDRDFDRIIGDEIDDNVVVDEGRKSQRSVALAASIQKGSLFLSWLTSSDNILMDVCELSSIHAPTIIDHLILVARHMQCVRNDGTTPMANQVVEGLFRVLTSTLHANPSLDPVDLRGESLPIYLLKTFMIQFGTETRVAVIDPVTRRFYDVEDRLAGLSFSAIAKEKVSQQDMKLLKRLLKELKFLVEEMVHRSRTFMLFPPPILFLCYQVYLALVRFHAGTTDPPPPTSEDGEEFHASAIDDLSSFIFLRFVCPSLVNLYSSEKRSAPPAVSSLAARILMHITGQLEGGWTKSQSSKVKKEIDMLINETRPKLRLFGEAVVENASRFSNRKVKHLIEEEILVLMDEDGNEHFLNGLETSLDSLITLMLESSGFKEFHSSISSLSASFRGVSDRREEDVDRRKDAHKIQLRSRQRLSRMSFCEGLENYVNQEYRFEESMESLLEEAQKEFAEDDREEKGKEDEDQNEETKKRSWSTSSVETPMTTGVSLKQNRLSMGPMRGNEVRSWGTSWDAPDSPAANCVVIGGENLDLLAWSSKAWNRRAEGRESCRWGKKDSRAIIQKTQSLVTKEFGPQPLSLGSQDSCPGLYAAMWCCVRETMLVGNIPRAVKDFVGSVVTSAIASPFADEVGALGLNGENGSPSKHPLSAEIAVEVEIGECVESTGLSVSSLEELFTLFVNQPQHLPKFGKIKERGSPLSPLLSPTRSSSSSYFSLSGRSGFSSSAGSPLSPRKTLPSESRTQKASTPPLPCSPLSSAPMGSPSLAPARKGGQTPSPGPVPFSFSSSASSPLDNFSSSSFTSASAFSSSNSLATSKPNFDAESEVSYSPSKTFRREKKDYCMSPMRKFRTAKKQKVFVANAQLSLSSLFSWSKAVTKGKGKKGFPKIIHTPPYPPSLEPELLAAVVLNSYLCRIAFLNFSGATMERPLAKMTAAKNPKKGVPGESLEVFQGLGEKFEEEFAESGYSWDEEPLVLTWARGSSRISQAFCRLLLEARREVDSFLSAAVIEYVELRVNEFDGTTSESHFDTLDWVDEEMKKFIEHSKSRDPSDLLSCQIALRTVYCPHLFQKKEKRDLRKKYKDKQWVGLIGWASMLVSCRLASLAIKMRDESASGYFL